MEGFIPYCMIGGSRLELVNLAFIKEGLYMRFWGIVTEDSNVDGYDIITPFGTRHFELKGQHQTAGEDWLIGIVGEIDGFAEVQKMPAYLSDSETAKQLWGST